jgi:hypothetical protein
MQSLAIPCNERANWQFLEPPWIEAAVGNIPFGRDILPRPISLYRVTAQIRTFPEVFHGYD